VSLQQLSQEHPTALDALVLNAPRIARGDQLSAAEVGDRGLLYMPVVSIDRPESVDFITAFMKAHPVAVECNMSEFNETAKQNLERLRNAGIKIWMNSIWPSLNAGHDDDRAVELFQPDESWGWILNQGTTIIQSDRCKELLRYLDMRKMR
jgi:glycerophosphoryl diester phosphodiesterase